MSDDNDEREKTGRLDPASLIDGILKRAGKVAGGTLDIAVDMATMSAMSGESWVRDLLVTSASPERLEAMAEAGVFLFVEVLCVLHLVYVMYACIGTACRLRVRMVLPR